MGSGLGECDDEPIFPAFSRHHGAAPTNKETLSFIVFALVILGTALIASYSTQYHRQRFIRFRDQSGLAKLAIVTALVVVTANVVVTFAEYGPWQCPDNPLSYWLFD